MMHPCVKTAFPLIVFFSLLLEANSQEMLGVVNSNYAGVNSAMINPANTGTTGQIININLMAGDMFISSDYFYIHRNDYGFMKMFRIDTQDPKYLYIYYYPEENYYDSVYYFDYFKNTAPKNLYFNSRVAGPSVMYHRGKHAFSLVTAFRNNISVEKMPYDLADFVYRGQQFRPIQEKTFTHELIRFAALSWFEAGLGYTYTFYRDSYRALNAGVTVKGLFGTGSAYGVVDNITYMIPNIDSIYFYNLNSTIGLSLPMNLSTNAFPDLNPLIKGFGWSFDIGVSYMKVKPVYSQNKKIPTWLQGFETSYQYRFGISLIDVGRITFNKSVQVNEYRNVTNILWSGLRTFTANSIQQFLRSASYHLLGDSMASLTSQTSYSIWLPTAASLQFDYNFGNNLFVNATFVQGVRLGQPSIRRPFLVAVTPRYETRNLEVNLPVSFYDFRDPQIGLAIRIFNLVVGTEKLGTFLNLTDVNGMDIYFSLGFNIVPKEKSSSGKCDSYEDYKRYQTR
jgi:hypothetical protein